MIGRSRTRRPVAWYTALAIAGATPQIAISATLGAERVDVRVVLVDEQHVQLLHVGVHRHQVLGEIGVGHRPKRASTRVSSSSAMPMPPTMPLMHWLCAIFGLITRPMP